MPIRLANDDDDESEASHGAVGFRDRTNIRSRLLGSDDEGDDEDEAREVRGGDDEVVDDEEEDDGEDLMETAMTDYKPMADLDKYDEEDLDNEDYDELSRTQRMAAERDLDKRDKDDKRKRMRMPQALMSDDEADEDEGLDQRPRRAKNKELIRNAEMAQGTVMEIDLENLEATPEFLASESVANEIKRRFRAFLRGDGSDNAPYMIKIEEMCAKNFQSLFVSFTDLAETQPQVAVYLAECPKIILPYFDDVAKQLAFDRFPNYEAIHASIHVRITELTAPESLRDLRCTHLNSLIKISGVVTRRTAMMPQLRMVRFKCSQPDCGELYGPYQITSEAKNAARRLAPEVCLVCNSAGSVRQDFSKTIYGSFQRITLQESPGTVPAGRVPRQKEVVFTDDLIDAARPGEEIEVTGVYVSSVDRGLNASNSFPVFSTLFEANFVQKREDTLSGMRITEQDRKNARKLAEDPRIVERIINSIAPSVYGHQDVKTGLAMAMFGGREKNIDDKHRVRGDVNVLLLGDPGTAKSQCLKYVEKTAPRAVFTTGKGASAVGLTASVHKDPISREWVLEGGALVLADRGVCLIDEFDKMNDRDRTSIHEAMEQQSISISKAGIVTTLQARCSVIAAANPIGGRYDSQRSFAENVELTDPILQRFDVLCVLQDLVDPNVDRRLAQFVVSSHVRSHPDSAANGVTNVYQQQPLAGQLSSTNLNPATQIDQESLRKYIMISKTIKPRMNISSLDQNKIIDVYVQMRKHSVESGGLPIGVRHAESMIRMAEAFARMHLREFVTMDDFDRSIAVMVKSFIAGQRYSVKRTMNRYFLKYVAKEEDNTELLLFTLGELAKELSDPMEDVVEIALADFASRASQVECERYVQEFVQSERFRQAGYKIQGDGNARVITKHMVVM